MDINDWRSLVTVLGFLCFLGIVAWAYSSRAKARFDEAARIPFLHEDELDSVTKKGNDHG